MHILAIETSCDETAVAVLKAQEQKLELLSNIVSSQAEIHAPWGGVVPNLAAREHVKNILPVLDEALLKAQLNLFDIDVFAVTNGPGLIPALLVGVNASKALSYFTQKPLVDIHHIEGHIYANFLNNKDIQFPLLALVVSGGHTQLVFMPDHFKYQIVGQTHDDAVGEAFDKVAKILDLGYPGGPKVSQCAKRFEKKLTALENHPLAKINFPRPMLKEKNLTFSFSGLKTAVLYFYQKNQILYAPEEQNLLKDAICWSFQEAAVQVLTTKTLWALEKYLPKTVLLAGGVAANEKLRESLQEKLTFAEAKVKFINPALEFCGDNAAMIATAAFFRYQKSFSSKYKNNWKNLEASANLKLKN